MATAFLDIDPQSDTIILMLSITFKELHQTTGEQVRRAGSSRVPVVVTDRGRPVAVLANPSLLRPRRRTRTLLPDYQALMSKKPGNDVLDDLHAIRGADR